jgi:hypothetical protein
MVQARARNRKELVTGVLLYCNGAFLQCLEGPKAGVNRVYNSICDDSRHHQVTELVREPVTRREYSEWWMALCFVGGDLRSEVDELLLSRLSRMDLGTSASRHLVSAFWASAIGVKYNRAVA